ncbi:AAA family ATPase [Nocardiopsis lambiniae]|uniref:ATP-binding protein n=1 Tax=Nocardiopsis lambiniae TaxID=3075539 RepID=A0ABU2M6V2_9ACTN|nr:ATP-binding protein [Nocardiopsis sp. DSM 44743]MDT0328242.1 ATP-binding protein [Nocardiopsis sp. DSM 44743]
MLLSFRVENHKSIREEQQLLLTPVYDDARPRKADWEAVTVAGIFGANASGKSNFLNALALMRDTVRWSMSGNEPGGGILRYPFAFEAEARERPSTFVVDLVLDGVRYTYGFAIDDERVVEEWLYSYPKKRKRVLFEREVGDFSFGDHTPAKLRQVEAITAENTLFLTVAARTSNEEVEPIYRWFSEVLVFASEHRCEQPVRLRDGRVSRGALRSLADLLASAGTGVLGVELSTVPPGPASSPSHPVENLEETRTGSDGDPDIGYAEVQVPVQHREGGYHGNPKGLRSDALIMRRAPEILFRHSRGSGADPLLPWEEESSGTRALVTLGFEAQRVLENGGVLVVDEIDASLHPHLSATLVSLFQDEEHNAGGAQLIFTSHDAALLGNIRGEEVLQRDHVWFVEKDGQARTSLYPLSDFKPRGDENRVRRYLVGRYGAVPEVDDELFREALRRRAEKTESGAEPVPTEESLW